MNVALWVVQVSLAIFFLTAGSIQIIQPKAKLAVIMAWVEDFSAGTVRLIGILEILGAIGIVLPALMGIFPWLTSPAAFGLLLTMIGAAITHARRSEYSMIIINVALLVLTAFVAYGRFVVMPL